MSTIGPVIVFSLRSWSIWIPTGFHVPRSTWEAPAEAHFFRLQGFHLLWPRIPARSARKDLSACLSRFGMVLPRPPVCNGLSLHRRGLGCSRFARRYSGNRYPLFSWGYLDVSVPPVPVPNLCVQLGTIRASPDRSLPTAPRGLSQLSHALHRLLAPRHPPYALSNLIATLPAS